MTFLGGWPLERRWWDIILVATAESDSSHLQMHFVVSG